MEVNWSILYNIGDKLELVESAGFLSSKSGIVVDVVESVRNDVDFIANLFDNLRCWLVFMLEEERLLVLPRSTNVGRHLFFDCW